MKDKKVTYIENTKDYLVTSNEEDVLHITDVKIGNLISKDGKPFLWKIDCYDKYENNKEFRESCKPLILSAELLKLLGFKQKKSENVFVYDGYLKLSLEDDYWGEPCFDFHKKSVSNRKFKGWYYITCLWEAHHLQNIFKDIGHIELNTSKILAKKH